MAVVPDPRLSRLLTAMRAVRDGDLAARAAVAGNDELAELGELFNQLAEHNQALASQIAGLSGAAALHRLTETAGETRANTGVSAAPPSETAATPDLSLAPQELAEQVGPLKRARLELNEQARQLAIASRAKAEFTANISHELRTPLSSLLILAQLLATNSEGNLTARQVDFARTIHGAAQDLLRLINDLLDLSNVEIGRMSVHAEQVSVDALVANAESAVQREIEDKGLELIVRVANDVPDTIDSDEQRLQQILRNLLSNAVKFTERGTITLEVSRDPADQGMLRFAVHDTGIGIAPDRHDAIFEAFQHGDDVAVGRSGGAGLGLSISRELTRLLGGELRVNSTAGQGSTFTLIVPVKSAVSAGEVMETRARIRTRQQAGSAGGERTANSALAENAGAATTPSRPAAAQAGKAAGDPTDHLGLGSAPQPAAIVLVVEPRAARAMQQAARTAIDGLGSMRGRVDLVTMSEVSSREVERTLNTQEVVSVLVNLSTPQSAVQSLLEAVSRLDPTVPVLAYEAGAGGATAARLVALGGARGLEVIGSRAQAVERLTLHLLTALPNATAEFSLAAEPPQSTARFSGEKVLVVDDDVRNVFALTSALELHGFSVVHADNGRQGIETLLQNPDIRLVLMDVMMPGMDGYAATQYIRSLEQFADLPIIAVTAKAMHGDRERSLAAGANAHVAKPVEVGELLAIIGSMIGR